MGQQELFDWLKERKGQWFTTVDIRNMLYPGCQKGNLSKLLQKLVDSGCAKARWQDKSHKIREFTYRAEDEQWDEESEFKRYY